MKITSDIQVDLIYRVFSRLFTTDTLYTIFKLNLICVIDVRMKE